MATVPELVAEFRAIYESKVHDVVIEQEPNPAFDTTKSVAANGATPPFRDVVTRNVNYETDPDMLVLLESFLEAIAAIGITMGTGSSIVDDRLVPKVTLGETEMGDATATSLDAG